MPMRHTNKFIHDKLTGQIKSETILINSIKYRGIWSLGYVAPVVITGINIPLLYA